MTKKLITLILCFALYAGLLRAQHFPLPDDYKFDWHAGGQRYTKYVIPCITWLQQTPLDQYREERTKINDFVLNWLQVNPDISIGLPEYSYTFHEINDQLLYLFIESWIKYTLETKDTNITNCRLAGIHGMLDYYRSGKAVGVGRNDFLDNLSSIEQQGKLPEMFDTTSHAKNTWLYLKTPSRKEYKYSENYLNFNFYCINLLHPRKIVYRYLLSGYYDKWIETREGSVTYPRLPPGEYTFQVQASMYPDFSRAAESTYSFVIGKPLWQEAWFLAIVSISGILLIYFIIKQREKNLKHIARLKHERIMFEYEHLKSQVNPHLLFNSLNTLANLIAKDPAKAINYTENLSSLYHSILAHHENDLVLLSDEVAILENYFSIQRGRFGDALQLRVNIPDEVARTKKIVPLALQILIENAIKHNVISESAPLVIFIAADEHEVSVRNAIYPKMSKERGEGLGLVNIKRRYELLTKQPVVYGTNENEFIVKLPLL